MKNENQNNNEFQTAENKLKNINIFFAAYGSFFTGLFSIFQYFFAQYKYFNVISLVSALLILGITYFFAYSKWATTFSYFWMYIEKCANTVGILNPIILAISIMLSVSKSLGFLLICIVLTAMHFILYLIVGCKCLKKEKKHVIKSFLCLFKRNIALLITIALAVITFVLWFFSSDKHDFADLWLNLLSGFISSIITIAVIDKILKNQKDKNETPLKKAMYRDIQLFTSRFIGLWGEMYIQSTEKRDKLFADNLFESDTIDYIRNNLDLEGRPNVLPAQNWFTYVDSCRKDLVNRGEKIINSYVSIADPEVIQSIHYLINDSFLIGNLSFLQKVHSVDLIENIPRPPLLACYTPGSNTADKEMVSQLLSWCRMQYKKLHDNTNKTTIDIYPIPHEICVINPKNPPSSMMSEERKTDLFNRFTEWQNRDKN